MMNQFERRKDLVDFLYKHRTSSRQELAERYDVSMRTIENDIKYLEKFYAIYTKQGNGGGIFVEPYAELYKECLTTYEEYRLRKILASLDIEDAIALESIIMKFGRR